MASVLSEGWTPGRSETAPRPGVWLTDVMLVGMAVVWGVNYSVVKLATRYFEPLVFNAIRVSLATAVLGAIAYSVRASAPSRRDMLRLALLGVLGHGIYQVGFVEGIAHTSAGTAALIFAASPAFIGIVGRLLGTEHPGRRAWIGIALQLCGMAGVVIGSATRQPAPGESTSLLGPAIILGAAIAWAFYSVLLKPYAERTHPIHLATFTLFGGVAVFALVATPGLLRLQPAALPPVAWGAVLYSGLGAMVIAYLFYYRGVRVLGPVKTAMFSNLQPIIALGVAYLVFGEIPSIAQVGGALLIMSGLLASRA
jgi:drug/metabolite transporter (DMT)-like permease